MGVVLYIAVKLLAYFCWVYFGLQLFRGDQSPLRAAAYALFRLFLGFLFGLVIFFLLSLFSPVLGAIPMQSVFAYLLIYVPVRWVEWMIMATLLNPNHLSFEQAVTGAGRSDRLWRLGGIAISCIADVPIILFLGGVIPTGRILC